MMEAQLIKSKIMVDDNFLSMGETVEAQVDIIVPDIYPDAARILDVFVSPKAPAKKIFKNGVSVSGSIPVTIVYMSEGEDKDVRSVSSVAKYDSYINVSGINDETFVMADVDIKNISYELINSRKMSARASVEISIVTSDKKETQVVSGFEDDLNIQILKKSVSSYGSIIENEQPFFMSELIHVPNGKPPITNILNSKISVFGKETKVLDDKVIIKGSTYIDILYNSNESENAADCISAEIPWTEVLDVHGIKEDIYPIISYAINDFNVSMEANSDEGGSVLAEIEVLAVIKCEANESVETISDCYALDSDMEIITDKICLSKQIGEIKDDVMIKEAFSIEDKECRLKEIYSVSAKVIDVNNKIDSDKGTINGSLLADIIYITENPDMPIKRIVKEFPFTVSDNINACEGNTSIGIFTNITALDATINGNGDIVFSGSVSVTGNVLCKVCEDIIVDCKLIENEEYSSGKKPMLIIYFIQKGDTLWKIGKKYGVSVDEIIAANNIENPNIIHPGDKIFIPIKHMR